MGEHKDVSLGVFILVALFGMSSWLGVNSIWMELPLTVVRLPELWALPSYLAVILQVANIGAVILTVVNTVKPGSLKAQPIIYGILIIQIVATFCVALFWQRTTVIGGEDHSTALFILMFFIAICNTTSNIVFLPFMARYRHEYITALFVGMGLSALLPSVVALVQGGGTSSNCVNVSSPLANNGSEWSLQTPMASTRFGVDMFYTIITGLLCVSFLSFVLLTCLPRLRRHQLPRGGPPRCVAILTYLV
ncbi:PREDICTED: riboflavin transporter 2-like [Priapulus caudatus]|uniref:Riboflavin transporter n=1 Tax=Priapulus caudatus TaxID=37621 RepID=A0ABM1F2F1_PRICU|nr:PREDICTED: riboflavin transporter 2-like [Priapulus caudatus]